MPVQKTAAAGTLDLILIKSIAGISLLKKAWKPETSMAKKAFDKNNFKEERTWV